MKIAYMWRDYYEKEWNISLTEPYNWEYVPEKKRIVWMELNESV